MKLLRLTLENFKGISHFKAEFGGEDAIITGDNGVGKTTAKDAFLWLFRDKDSRDNQLGPNVKPLDEAAEVKHGLTSAVEATLELEGGEEETLRKEYAEKWTTKRGADTERLTGHETSCLVDAVPVQKTEFDETVEDIMPADLFAVLSDPKYFAATMHWSDRREMLLDLVGEVTLEDVIAANGELAELPEILEDRTPDQYRKVAASRLKKIRDTIESLPDRIDEASKAITEVDEDMESLQDQKSQLQDDVGEVREQKQSGSSAEAISKKKAELTEVESQIRTEKADAERKVRKDRGAIDEQISDIKRSAKRTREDIERKEKSIEELQGDIKKIEPKMDQKRQRWHELDQEEKELKGQSFSYDEDEAETVCPTCGQGLPEEQLEEARAEAEAAFNEDKADRLEKLSSMKDEVSDEGIALKEKREVKQEKIEQLQDELGKLEDDLPDDLDERIGELREKQADIEPDLSALEPLQKKKEALEEEVEELRSGNGDDERQAELQEQIDALEKKLSTIGEKISTLRSNERQEKRIEELKAQEQELAEEEETLQRHLHLLDVFTTTKVNLLEDSINDRFELANFKLFEVQVNGGINEICEVLYRGVPYTSLLNHAAQITVGLDIIDTFAEEYSLHAPVFVDHSESINDENFPEVDYQLIRLRFAAGQDELQVETLG